MLKKLLEYRFIEGTMKFNNSNYGWLDVTVGDKRLHKELEQIPFLNKIVEVEQFAESEPGVYRQLPPNMSRECW